MAQKKPASAKKPKSPATKKPTTAPVVRRHPSFGAEAKSALTKVRTFCEDIPGFEERLSHSAPSFFIGKKAFGYFWDNHHGDGHLALWLRFHPEPRAALIKQNPDRFFLPPYVAHLGWIGVEVSGKAPWPQVEGLMHDAARLAGAWKEPKAARKWAPATKTPRKDAR